MTHRSAREGLARRAGMRTLHEIAPMPGADLKELGCSSVGGRDELTFPYNRPQQQPQHTGLQGGSLYTWHPRTTPPKTLRFWRVSSRSGNVPECISGASVQLDATTSSGKCSTTPSTRR